MNKIETFKYLLLFIYSSMIEDILVKIGLTQQEARTYLALLELQESKTGELCRHTKIASSNIYNILDSLIKKGLVSYKIKNNVKIFMPSNPETLNELFLNKQKKLDEERKDVLKLISELKKKDLKEESYSNYKYYEGFTGIKAMWNEFIVIKEPSKFILKAYTGKRENYERLIGFYNEIHRIRLKKKIRVQTIFPLEDREHGLKRRKLPSTEVKFMQMETFSGWGVFGENLYLMYITEKTPRAFLIKDIVFAKTFEQVFDQLWKIAKR